MKITTLIFGFSALLIALPVAAETRHCTVQSGPGTIVLLELYTSEGCSSCPPADRWLSRLTTDKRVSGRVVPLSLHVDYWNYLGWRDPFSQPRFTERQASAKVRAGARGVYTPQMFMNGREYLGWYRHDDIAQTLTNLNRQPARAAIHLRLSPSGKQTIDANARIALRDPAVYERMGVYLALYENRLINRVTAGENRGEHLRHDRVVRKLEGPLRLKADGSLSIRHRFALAPDWKPADLGVVVFVQDRANGEVLQTLALGNCR